MDYDGTRSSASESSMNYSIQEYANDAIYSIVDACEKNGLRQPNIVTESGRSLTAHHSVLITEVLETTSLPTWKDSEDLKGDEHELVKELYEIWDRLDQQTIFESWHDALQIREEVARHVLVGNNRFAQPCVGGETVLGDSPRSRQHRCADEASA